MLTGKQRAYLKKLAIDLDAAVYIGKNELTDNTVSEMDRYLDAHEMVKVKLQEGAELDVKETANRAAQLLSAEYVQSIGRKFVLYRRNPESPSIVLPR